MNTLKQSLSQSLRVLPVSAAGGGDGLYHCSHCGHVVTPSLAQIELAENAPEADPALKCPHCHKHTVHWRKPSPARARLSLQPVTVAHGKQLFAGICQMLATK